jgi:nicotinamidase-related amidase
VNTLNGEKSSSFVAHGGLYNRGAKASGDDLVISKARYSAFFGTKLDTVLKTYGIKYLLFTGIATKYMC